MKLAFAVALSEGGINSEYLITYTGVERAIVHFARNYVLNLPSQLAIASFKRF
jgi:hypothetical protein